MSKRKQLSDLLQEAEQLTCDIGGEEDLPHVTRNLQQIAEAGQRLLSRTSARLPEDHTDVKASILLGSRGFDVPKLSARLETLNTTKSLEPLEPVWETDIEGYLRNERENTLLAIIEESKKNTFFEADRGQWQGMVDEWEREKEKILNSLLGSGQDILELPSQNETMTSDPFNVVGRSALDSVEMAYAREVYRANEAELGGLQQILVPEFYNASKNFTDKGICDAWSLVNTLIDVPVLPPKAYEHRTTVELQKQFVNQARSFLEKQYENYIKDLIYHSLPQAQLGGVPSTLNLVRSFLNLKQVASTPGLEDGHVMGQPLWALVFYCLRCGDLEDALKVLSESSSDLMQFLQEYIDSNDKRLPPSSESRLQLLYKRNVRTSTDPYKRAVYCLLASCDINDNHSHVLLKTEDYMWLKLCQIHFDPVPVHSHRGVHSDRMSLSEFQKLLFKDYGESHFNATQNPHLYFQVLLLSLQFEAAISFLSQHESLRSHAVHFALAFHNLELINITKSFHSNLFVEEPNGVQYINIGRLVVSFTRKFVLTDSREALEYFYRLRELKDGRGKNLFLSCVSDLVMESREFEMLLGKKQSDNSTKPGCIHKFAADIDIVGFVAVEAEEKGLFEDAIRLYDLAGTPSKVFELLCHLLGAVVSASSTAQSDRGRLQNLAVSIAARYRSNNVGGDEPLLNTFYLILDLMQFFDNYHAKRLDVALQIMRELKLLPLQTGETLEQRVLEFREKNDLIRQCYPDILIAVMSILYTNYRQSSVSTPHHVVSQDGGKEEYQSRLRNMARMLITFAGMLPYQMTSDVNARLVQMEVLMNN